MPLDVGSALRLYLNGSLVSETPLPPGPDFPDRRRTILLPVAHMRPFGNTFLFNFDFIPTNPNRDDRDVANRLVGDILQDSWVDLRGVDHWAAMPDLELFANAGISVHRARRTWPTRRS